MEPGLRLAFWGLWLCLLLPTQARDEKIDIEIDSSNVYVVNCTGDTVKDSTLELQAIQINMTINLLRLSPAPCFLAKQADDSRIHINDELLSRTNVTFYGRVERNDVTTSFLQMIVIESPSVSSCRDAGCPSKLNTSANFDCLFFVLKSDVILPTDKKPPQTDQRVYAKIICHMTGTDVANDLQKMTLQDGDNDILTLQDSSLQNTENLTTLLSNNHLVSYHFNKNSTHAKLTAYLPVVQDSHTAYHCLAETKQNLSRVVSGTITSNKTSHNVTPGLPGEFSIEMNSADSKWKTAVVVLSLLLAIVVVVVAVAVIFCKRKKCARVCQQENVKNNDEDNRNSPIGASHEILKLSWSLKDISSSRQVRKKNNDKYSMSLNDLNFDEKDDECISLQTLSPLGQNDNA